MNITEIKELLAGAPTAEQLATLAADERKGVQQATGEGGGGEGALYGDAEIGTRAV